MSAHSQHTDDHVHVVPLWFLAAIFGTLLVLTYLTVAATSVDLGGLNIWIALAIATVKGALVVLFFMHLLYDHPFNGMVFLASLVFVALFLGYILMDTTTYNPDIIWGYAPALAE